MEKIERQKNQHLKTQQWLLHWLTLLEFSVSPENQSHNLVHFSGFRRSFLDMANKNQHIYLNLLIFNERIIINFI